MNVMNVRSVEEGCNGAYITLRMNFHILWLFFLLALGCFIQGCILAFKFRKLGLSQKDLQLISNVVEVKLTVFMYAESYLNEQIIYIHHELENAENVLNFLGYQQVRTLHVNLVFKSISENVSIISTETILQEVTDKILLRESIRWLCYNIFLWEKNMK